MRFKRGRGNGAARDEIFINLASLIDIIFVLLLFFIVTTTFTRENQLTIELPESSIHNPITSTNVDRLEITISNDGKYAVNGRVLPQATEGALSEALVAESKGDRDLPVLVTADANAKYQAVITAMSAAGQLGFSKLRLVTVESDQ
ncbi:ExbD/TolR family protein [Entomomonas asaccharolytica]|uniref:Biopolymer transporter ExbD n=1 Tax=Entomomonas asaccharolytica TaxID=2785331 RepID=A0A974RWH1_9GAMM|nr:biopolymer transporter ExbD [Entomomonas asaccharolytica]QQP85132.1 biopolymer transporter ExbD [Entomomonas asaccharolytica]